MILESMMPVQDDAFPVGTTRIDYRSGLDGVHDHAFYLAGDPERTTVVYLHGSFSGADQVFTRQDIRDFWLSRIMARGHSLLSVNMRGTSYMSPAATDDMAELLGFCREYLACQRFVLLGGSGGASSAMAFAVLHPELLHGVVAMGMCDIRQRLEFARLSPLPVLQELARTVFAAYGGDLEERPDLYEARSVLLHADRLTMPAVLTMGEKDALIPVQETRKVAEVLSGNPRFSYHEVPGGNHDSALWVDVDLETVQLIQG